MESDRVQLKGTPLVVLGNLPDWAEKLTPKEKATVRFERLKSTGEYSDHGCCC